MLRPPPTSTLFPYTTLFRSDDVSSVDTRKAMTEELLKRYQEAALTQIEQEYPALAADVQAIKGGRFEARINRRSEEHTSELQSQSNLVCRLLLEKKKNNNTNVVYRLKETHHKPMSRYFYDIYPTNELFGVLNHAPRVCDVVLVLLHIPIQYVVIS